jgi:hypothetical protein
VDVSALVCKLPNAANPFFGQLVPASLVRISEERQKAERPLFGRDSSQSSSRLIGYEGDHMGHSEYDPAQRERRVERRMDLKATPKNYRFKAVLSERWYNSTPGGMYRP